MAANTRVGAFAVDLTRAQSRRPEGRRFHGNSLRLSFSKRLDATGTNFSLLAYRYTTSGFLSLTDAIAVKEQLRQQQPFDSVVRQRHRFDANISQQWGRGSSVRQWLDAAVLGRLQQGNQFFRRLRQ